ncbi:MAG: hypothetical protein EOP86_18090 [Verrucomicrobiaceae bacterium]|nr:MAG: hypothetical protein EOP86_18090 [Verrucomicrobiaceae bacterium]
MMLITMPDAYGFLNLRLIDTRGDSLGFLRLPYLIFNAVEAVCWLAVSLVILWRFLRHRKSRREIYYALAFLAFGLSDVIETSGTTALLLLFKGACLLAIAGFRPGIMALHGSRGF